MSSPSAYPLVVVARPIIGRHQHYAVDREGGRYALCDRRIADDHLDGPIRTQFWCVTVCPDCHARAYGHPR